MAIAQEVHLAILYRKRPRANNPANHTPSFWIRFSHPQRILSKNFHYCAFSHQMAVCIVSGVPCTSWVVTGPYCVQSTNLNFHISCRQLVMLIKRKSAPLFICQLQALFLFTYREGAHSNLARHLWTQTRPHNWHVTFALMVLVMFTASFP